MFNNQTTAPSSTYVCHKWVIALIKSQHSMALADSHHAVWKWQKYSAYDDVRIHCFHIMQYEMNTTNRFITNQRGLGSRRDQKREVKQGGAETCDNITSDLMTTYLSKVLALHAELSAVWFSNDMHLHTNAGVTNLSICPFPWEKTVWVLQKCTRLPPWKLSELQCKTALNYFQLLKQWIFYKLISVAK